MDISNLTKYACFGDGDMCAVKDIDKDNIQRYVKVEDIEKFLKLCNQTVQINYMLKNMELDYQRIDFLSESFDGICRHCGAVANPCYCMNDD